MVQKLRLLLLFALEENTPDKADLRETFFLNQLAKNNTVTYPEKGDFLVNDKCFFEKDGKK